VNPIPAFGVGANNKPLLTRGRSPLKYATTVEAESPLKTGIQPTFPPPPPPPQSPKSDVTEPPGLAHEPGGDKLESDGEDVKSPSSTVGPSAAVPKTPVCIASVFSLFDLC
jgi:hypothetical protein